MNSHFGTPRRRGKRLAAGLGKREAVLMAIAAAQLLYVAFGSAVSDFVTRLVIGCIVAGALLFVARFRAPQNNAPLEQLLWMHLRYRWNAARGRLVDTFQTARPQQPRDMPQAHPKRSLRMILGDWTRALQGLFKRFGEWLRNTSRRPSKPKAPRAPRAPRPVIEASGDAVEVSYSALLATFALCLLLGTLALYTYRAGLAGELLRLLKLRA